MNASGTVVIGATSGIGRELAKVLDQHGYEVGLTGRRLELLQSLKNELNGKSYIRQMDVTDTEAGREILSELLEEMDDVGLIIINAGVSPLQPKWPEEKNIIDVNVTGFVALASLAMDYFEKRGSGHIVGISSVAALAGLRQAAVYSASKAFISTYMQALRQKSKRFGMNITVTDIKPGYVRTKLIDDRKGLFWIIPLEKAVNQIYDAIKKQKNHVYISKRWRLVGWLLKSIPDWLYIRLPA